ncbi:MAG: hypothetical protein K9J06_04800 [Flavobacteriales bacterium]|nr:hypothetical protein [Flavobacteriales bacterium]
MKSIFLVLFSISVAYTSSASGVFDGADPVNISIMAKDSGEEILVDVAAEVEGSVTLSIFSETGEIVINEHLNAGGNRIKLRHLRPGQYVAVVRQNDEFRQKQTFKVN